MVAGVNDKMTQAPISVACANVIFTSKVLKPAIDEAGPRYMIYHASHQPRMATLSTLSFILAGLGQGII